MNGESIYKHILCLIYVSRTHLHILLIGVIHVSISDHSLVYVIRKAHFMRERTRTVEIRPMENFNKESFLRDLKQKFWNDIYCSQDPNEMWNLWKGMLMQSIDKHAPLKARRVRNRKCGWITNDLRHQIFNRDYLKKKAITTNDPEIWYQYISKPEIKLIMQ